MKKVFAILAIVALASCGGAESSATAVDTTKKDTTPVAAPTQDTSAASKDTSAAGKDTSAAAAAPAAH